MNRRLLALYPRAWRERYGDELADLSDDLIAAGETTPLRASLGVIAEAARERGRSAVTFGAWPAMSASVCLIAGTVPALNRRGGAMLPYFDRHAIGNLLLIVIVCWFFLEFILFMRVQERRDHSDGVVRTGRAGWWLLAGVCVIVANVWMYLAPTLVPEATIRRGAIAFTVGMVILVAGIGLRLWSVLALDRLFSMTIRVRPDQAVVTAGPYRLVRHPCYAGSLLAAAGIGLTSANWIGLAAMTLLPLIVIVWRIRIEEDALVATIGDRYRSYASGHKRLLPLVW